MVQSIKPWIFAKEELYVPALKSPGAMFVAETLGELYGGGDNEVRAPLTDCHCTLAYGGFYPFIS